LHQKTVQVDKLRIGQRVKFKISLDFSGKPNADPAECYDTPDPLAGKDPGAAGDGMGCMGNMGSMGMMGMSMGSMGLMGMGGMNMGMGGMGMRGKGDDMPAPASAQAKPVAKSSGPQMVPPRGKGGDDASEASDLWSKFGMTRQR